MVTALLAVAVLPVASAPVRRVAGLVAAAQGVTAALTNYEGGIVPTLPLRQHRMVDLAAGAVLGLAGARYRSPMLLAGGAATFALGLLAETHAHHGIPDMLYRPLDVPKSLTRDVWLVDGVIPPGLPVRMTVIRLANGDLLLHSPTRFSAGLLQALEAIGPIRHLVAPNSVHWTFVKEWQDVLPDATVHAAPGLRDRGQVRRAGLRIDADLTARSPWPGEIELEIVPGGGGFHEVALFHRSSGTLMMTDLVQNFEPGKLPWLLRPLARLLGNVAPISRAPAYLRGLVALRRPKAAAAARRIVAWAPQRIVVTHGRPIEDDAARRLRSSLGWLTGEG